MNTEKVTIKLANKPGVVEVIDNMRLITFPDGRVVMLSDQVTKIDYTEDWVSIQLATHLVHINGLEEFVEVSGAPDKPGEITGRPLILSPEYDHIKWPLTINSHSGNIIDQNGVVQVFVGSQSSLTDKDFCKLAVTVLNAEAKRLGKY